MNVVYECLRLLIWSINQLFFCWFLRLKFQKPYGRNLKENSKAFFTFNFSLEKKYL